MSNIDKQFDYVIYHKGCIDGYSGFFILTGTHTISPDATIYPDVPSAKDPPPNINGKNMIIIDVAYSRPVLEQIFKEAKHVIFIDHHISTRNDVLQLAT